VTEPCQKLISVVAIQQIGAHQFDRDGPPDIRIVGLIYDAHGAAPELPLHAIAANE
jgi:hypothetical protein